jgi:hypothetical protein
MESPQAFVVAFVIMAIARVASADEYGICSFPE